MVCTCLACSVHMHVNLACISIVVVSFGEMRSIASNKYLTKMKCTKSVKQIVAYHSQNFMGGVSGLVLKKFIGVINNEAYIRAIVREQQMCAHILYFNTALLQYTIMHHHAYYHWVVISYPIVEPLGLEHCSNCLIRKCPLSPIPYHNLSTCQMSLVCWDSLPWYLIPCAYSTVLVASRNYYSACTSLVSCIYSIRRGTIA